MCVLCLCACVCVCMCCVCGVYVVMFMSSICVCACVGTHVCVCESVFPMVTFGVSGVLSHLTSRALYAQCVMCILCIYRHVSCTKQLCRHYKTDIAHATIMCVNIYHGMYTALQYIMYTYNVYGVQVYALQYALRSMCCISC